MSESNGLENVATVVHDEERKDEQTQLSTISVGSKNLILSEFVLIGSLIHGDYIDVAKTF